MGFRDRKAPSIYASPSKGFIVFRTEQGDKYGKYSAVSRKITKGIHEGELVWELNFPTYEGHLTNVYFNRAKPGTKYGDQVVFDYEDPEMPANDRFRKIKIQVDLDSNYAKQFIQVCQNINLSEPISVEPFNIPRTDKPDQFNTGWSFYQEGEIVKKTILKDDLPKVIKIEKAGGKTEYDRDDLIIFVEAELKKFMRANKMGEWSPKGEKSNTRSNHGADEEVEEGEDEAPKKRKPPVDDDDADYYAEEAEQEEKPATAHKAKAESKPSKQAAPDDDED